MGRWVNGQDGWTDGLVAEGGMDDFQHGQNEGCVEGKVGREGLDGRMDGMTNEAISQYRNYINSPACLAYLNIKTDFTHDGLNYCERPKQNKK